MDERQQLEASKEQFKSSMNNAWNDLKDYGKSIVNYANAVNAQRVEAAKQRIINFKSGVKQKASTIKSKLGQVKNDILSKISISNIDVKLKNLYEKAQLAGLTIVNKGVQVVNTVKEQVTDFAYTQMANHYIRQEEENAKIQEREKIVKAEMQKEEEIKVRTEEHKTGMKEALRERDRLEIQGKIINFKTEVKQRTSTLKSKLGQVKNDVLSKLSISNIDVKLRNMYEQAQLAGLTIINKGVQVVNNVKENVSDFAYTQMANYYLKQEERRIQKEFALAAKKAEQEEIQKMKEQRKARKNDMIAALNSQEREMYEEKHIENQTRKQELLNSLGMESQKLFGVDENSYEEPKRARAM